MEPFVNLPELTIQKLGKDLVATPPAMGNGSPDHEDKSCSDEASVEEYVGQVDSESDVEDDADSESEDGDEAKEQHEASAAEEGDNEDDEEVDDGTKAYLPERNLSAEEEKKSDDSPCLSKPIKRRKSSDAEKDAVKKKKRKKKKEVKKEQDTDSESDSGKKRKEKRTKNMRKNIREVMKEDELDEETKAAQRLEMERLKRFEEQQRKWMQMEREKQKAAMMQAFMRSPAVLNNCTITPMGLNSAAVDNQLPSFHSWTSQSEEPPYESAKSGQTDRKNHLPDVKASIDRLKSTSFGEVSITSCKPESATVAQKDPNSTKQKECVTISSSDDDCMIVAASDAEDEIDDPTNSGSHTNDLFNIPDEQGRVLVNILEHARGDPAVYLAPQIARVIKAHQIGGIRFLYDNVIESLERCRTSDGFGCILAHSMGLGKTLQVVSFCDIFLRHTEGRHVLCIMPINTLQNWLAEFNMWVPEEVPLNATEEIRPRNFKLHVLNDAQKTLAARAKVIRQWRLDGGVLLIGYELYRLLSLRRDKGSKKKKFTPLVELEDEDNRKKVLWSEIHTALIKPGPDLVICDEGHRIKNSHASISHALKSIQTKRRVVLTGYPLQNNLMEYWCMVDFVRPNYLGTKAEFSNMFERPIQNGQCVDSTAEDVKTMRYRAHVLHSLLNGFVQRRSHEVLQKALPQKNEYVLLFRMTPIQRLLYSAFMNEVVKTKAVANPLKAFSVCCKIWNHPDILFCFLKKRMEGDDLDLEDPVVANSTGPNAEAKTGKTNRSKKTAKPTTEDKIEVAPNQEPAPAVQNPDYQNFGYGESSNQFNQQLYHQDFYNNPQQHSFQQPQNQFQSSGDDSFNSFGMSQSFQPQQQLQGWQQQAGFTQNQNLYDGQYENPYAMLPTTLEQRPKNDAPMNALDRRGAESKEIQSIEKMLDEKLENQKDDEIKGLLETGSNMPKGGGRDDNTIPYDWATEILKGYKPGVIENSSKMLALFCILEESLKVGDRILLFSQSLFTLNLIEDFLHQNFVPETDEKWAKNVHYFRLDGSTAAIERERLINEFNANPRLSLFLVSTRAGSLGINLVGANRVIVFDASWNPCHDTQAVCRVYRYGQMKKCYVYRLVMDNCLEKKIYDRQINKQGMADRVVDELNPDAHLSLKEVSNLLCDSEEEAPLIDLSLDASKYSTDSVLHNMLKKYGTILTKSPFQHESLLVDRKDKKLSKAEKRLAQRHYDQEKQASSRPSFNNYYGGQQGSYSTSGGGIVHSAPATLPIRHDQHVVPSMRPSLPRPASTRGSRWVPPEAFRKYGMEVKEIRLEKDYTMEANTPDRVISLKAGQKALILRGPKGVFMQTEDGKIVALRSKHPQFGPPDAKSNVVKNLLPRHSQLTVTARPVAQPQRHATWANAMVPPDVLDLANSSSSSNSPGGMVVPGADDSFPLPATAQKKHLPPSYNEHQQQQQQQHLQFLQPSMRSSGGGIVGSNANEYSYQQNFNSYEQPQQQQQQQSYGNNSYSAFHRPDFVPNEASNAGYASQYDYAGNMYHAEMYATPPAYLQENYTYQQQPGYNNSMFSSSSQSSGQHYSHPQS